MRFRINSIVTVNSRSIKLTEKMKEVTMNTNVLLSEEEVLRIIEEEFGTSEEEDFGLVVAGHENGGLLC